MNNIKKICKHYRNNPAECIKHLRALKANRSTVGHWVFYAASIGYEEVFRACWSQVEECLRAPKSKEYTKRDLLMNACVGGNPKIFEIVAVNTPRTQNEISQ